MPASFQAVVKQQCPRCRKGPMFKYPLAKVHKFIEMHETCPNCGLRFEVEPGFFFGAMYISYAVSVALFAVIGFIIFQIDSDPPFWSYTLLMPGVVILLIPVTFRYSRVLFLNLFGCVKYDPKRVG
jgi:uncharacterized protein (DUF983 family)